MGHPIGRPRKATAAHPDFPITLDLRRRGTRCHVTLTAPKGWRKAQRLASHGLASWLRARQELPRGMEITRAQQ